MTNCDALLKPQTAAKPNTRKIHIIQELRKDRNSDLVFKFLTALVGSGHHGLVRLAGPVWTNFKSRYE